MVSEDISSQLQHIQARIAAASRRAGRDPGDITLVTVTKTHPPELIKAAYAAGLRHFGENRVQELREKQGALALPDIRWHFVGHVQSRKARQLVGQVALIHSVDRFSLARELSKRGQQAGTVVEGLLQVNSSGEATKGGWQIHTDEGRDDLFRDLDRIVELPFLRLRGLMTMAPFYDDPEQTRPTFAALLAMQQTLANRFPEADFGTLSMGMTNDFEVAIEEGATHIRLGTALFGSRRYQ